DKRDALQRRNPSGTDLSRRLSSKSEDVAEYIFGKKDNGTIQANRQQIRRTSKLSRLSLKVIWRRAELYVFPLLLCRLANPLNLHLVAWHSRLALVAQERFRPLS